MQNAPFFVDNEVIRILKNGTWIADESEITHEPTQKLFAKSLFKNEKGYYLKIGRETKTILVEDTAFFVIRVDGEPHGKDGVTLTLSNEQKLRLNPSTLHYRPGRLTCSVKTPNIEEEIEAKFLSAPYFDLLKHLEEDHDSFFLDFEAPKARVTLSHK
jgi:hypothetical protein